MTSKYKTILPILAGVALGSLSAAAAPEEGADSLVSENQVQVAFRKRVRK